MSINKIKQVQSHQALTSSFPVGAYQAICTLPERTVRKVKSDLKPQAVAVATAETAEPALHGSNHSVGTQPTSRGHQRIGCHGVVRRRRCRRVIRHAMKWNDFDLSRCQFEIHLLDSCTWTALPPQAQVGRPWHELFPNDCT